jgi:trigger factor
MLIEGCKHELEITVPAEEIGRETDRAISDLQKKVRLPGFRPGKAPASIIRTRFAGELRQDVLEALIPKFFNKRVEEEELRVVGTPNVKEVHFDSGEPLRFKAEFEVAPVIELKDYRGVPVQYQDPEVSDEEIGVRLEALREQKAQYVNIDPRPATDGDYAVVDLDSVSGVEPPVHQEDMVIRVGDPEKMPQFAEALRGTSPDEEKEFDVVYQDDYAERDLAGKTIRFRLKLKMLRTKELPELNDEFAKDLGDFQTLDQVREAVRKTILREKELAAQQQAKDAILDKLIDGHDFPVPEAFIERQIDAEAENQFSQITGKAIDMRKVKESANWPSYLEQIRPKAIRNVKAQLLVERVADAESIHATNDEVDREVQRLARQEREPVAAFRKKLEKRGVVARIAHQIRTAKTMGFLFEHARKEA